MMERIFAIVIVIAYVALLYFIVFGKRKKERKKLEELNSRLAIGTRICTISGIYGTIVDMNDRDVIIEISCEPDKTIKAKLLRGAIKEIA